MVKEVDIDVGEEIVKGVGLVMEVEEIKKIQVSRNVQINEK